jgi:crotonobetainyl-CoA:carnitine CoA-transferase CaiB-like acyl-CoA transferase
VARGFSKVLSVGRNKRSILINIKDDRGLEIFHRLAATADVIVEGFRPGVAERLGIGYEAMRRHCPRLIYCSISGYGQDGPYRDHPGHDINYQAIGGSLPIGEDGRPRMPTTTWADRCATYNLQSAILLALLLRERSGEGRYVDVSIADSMVTLPLAESHRHPAINRIYNGGPAGSESPPPAAFHGHQPWYALHECADGRFLALGCYEPWFWKTLCDYAGHPEWTELQNDDGPGLAERRAHFEAMFRSRPRDAWLRVLQGELNLPVSPVNAGYEVIEEPHLQQRGVVRQAELPGGHRMWQLGPPFRLEGLHDQQRRAVTIVGQDTRDILQHLGYADGEVDALGAAGVVAFADLDRLQTLTPPCSAAPSAP